MIAIIMFIGHNVSYSNTIYYHHHNTIITIDTNGNDNDNATTTTTNHNVGRPLQQVEGRDQRPRASQHSTLYCNVVLIDAGLVYYSTV